MANGITSIRIVLSFALLFCPVFSSVFYALYIVAGLSDIADGAIARKTGTISKLGSKLDTVADLVFVTVCLIKLLPALNVPLWVWIWTGAIAIIKLRNIAIGYIRDRELISVQSVMNKVTGGMLFLFPLTLAFVDLRYGAVAVCAIATFAAVQEGFIVARA